MDSRHRPRRWLPIPWLPGERTHGEYGPVPLVSPRALPESWSPVKRVGGLGEGGGVGGGNTLGGKGVFSYDPGPAAGTRDPGRWDESYWPLGRELLATGTRDPGRCDESFRPRPAGRRGSSPSSMRGLRASEGVRDVAQAFTAPPSILLCLPPPGPYAGAPGSPGCSGRRHDPGRYRPSSSVRDPGPDCSGSKARFHHGGCKRRGGSYGLRHGLAGPHP